MRLQRRALALASATAALTATGLFAATSPASADQRTSQNQGMARMHELMREGNPGMTRMHERMREGNPGMAQMHERMMAGPSNHEMLTN
jgi:hypothetical protein